MKFYPYSQVKARHLGILLGCARVLGVFSIVGFVLAGLFVLFALALLVLPDIHFDGQILGSETNGLWLTMAGLLLMWGLVGVFLSSIFVALVRWEAKLGATE